MEAGTLVSKTIYTTCCISGGGPAGIMLGYLLARAGIDVVVLEKHGDFFRDFRGDTIHPSTFQIMHELGLLPDFLKVPHQEVQHLTAYFNGVAIPMADFTHLDVAHPALGLMPQWDFLNFLNGKARLFNNYTILQDAKVTALLPGKSGYEGLIADTPEGKIQINAKLIIGADGRTSDVRRLAGLEVVSTASPIDVLWFRLSRDDTDSTETFGRFQDGHLLVLINRAQYWQCAYVIEKGGIEKLKAAGLESLKHDISVAAPIFKERVNELHSWDDIKLLTVAINHLETWHKDNLLCIGDAAHAMSPVGGVGINLAIQDAVATANILAPALLAKEPVTAGLLHKVQARREFPVKVIQKMQGFIHEGIAARQPGSVEQGVPFLFRVVKAIPYLRRIPAWLVGIGIRREKPGALFTT